MILKRKNCLSTVQLLNSLFKLSALKIEKKNTFKKKRHTQFNETELKKKYKPILPKKNPFRLIYLLFSSLTYLEI